MNFPKLSLNFYGLLQEFFEKEVLKLELLTQLPAYEEQGQDLDRKITSMAFQGFYNNEKLDPKFDDLVASFKQLKRFILSQNFEALMDEVDDVGEMSLKALNVFKKLNGLKTVKIHFQHAPKIQMKTLKKLKKNIIDNIWKQKIDKEQKIENVRWEKKYNEVWINCKLNQQEIQIQKIVDQTEDLIKNAAMDQAVTVDACMNISRFYRVKIVDLNKTIKEIENKYENYIETNETDLQKAVSEKRRLNAIREQEHQTFEKRHKEIENYFSEKRRKNAGKKLLKIQEINAVLTIQAWWREILVRKAYKPFKAYIKPARQFRERRKAKKIGKPGK